MQNSKVELKNILLISIIVVLVILVFVFTVGYIINSVDPKHSIIGYSMAISFVGIFATFGGAFLGATISGRYTMKTIEISENNKSKINRMRANGLKQEVIKVTKNVLDKARPQDGGGIFTFEEKRYKRIRDVYIKHIHKLLKQISDFRMSENYYYLSNNDVEELDIVYSLIANLIFLIEDLNSRSDDGQNEKNPEFCKIKDDLFLYLEQFYAKYK